MADATAIDFAKLLETLKKLATNAPAIFALVMKLLALFGGQPASVMAAVAAHHCPDQCLHDCLTAQQLALCEALAHNAHMLECCKPDAP